MLFSEFIKPNTWQIYLLTNYFSSIDIILQPMLSNLLLQYFVLQSVHYLHNTISSKQHKRRTSSEEAMSKIPNLPVAKNATKLPDNEANNKEF